MIELFAILVLAAVTQLVGASPSRTATAPPADASAPIGADGIIGADDRKLLSEFTIDGVTDPAAMRASLGATQALSCGGASASLVYRSDVILFSAHQLLDDDGKLIKDLDHCVFEVVRKTAGTATTERYPLLLAWLDHGVSVAPGMPDDAWNRGNQGDWAVARLARPVAGIEPYRLPEQAVVGAPGSAVTTVSEPTSNWKGSDEPGNLAQNCHVIAAEPSLGGRYPAVMHLDCDVGHGASGSAILQDVASGSPQYVGTTIAYTGNHCRQAGLDTCFSIGRRLDADLIARIEGTTAMRSTPQERAFGEAQDARLAAGRDAVAAKAAAALAATFPARDDPQGRQAAALYGRIKALVADGRPAEADALFLEAFHVLHDAEQSRPEWPWLFLENGESMLLRHRSSDAFQCFHAAYAIAPDALKPYLQVRMAQTTLDADERSRDLREAYLAGGDALFRTAKADAELADVKAKGLTTTDE